MYNSDTQFAEFLAGEVKKYEGVMVPKEASILERMLIKNVRYTKLHPNPDDEFCFPSIGPNFGIISNYERTFRQYGTMRPNLYDEPLMVQKVRPNGYMILNGHHRWAAGMRVGFNKMPVTIVKLTQEKDIENMIRASKHDKRVTLDLDEVVFVDDKNAPMEKVLHFPYNRMYKERIRLGIPALLHYLGKQGYDVWVYSSKYYSYDYIRAYFKKYYVKLDGVITGTARKVKDKDEEKKKTEQLFKAKYVETIHVDNNSLVRSFRDSKEFEDYELSGNPESWSQEVMNVIKGLS
ncbi:MAG: ParB/RepB/Spo0J family partition protein [Lachnospiraceae bacterium]|nr:ParB/RepB/Spo0J family partition protein [Lachnospiraceae bacterium]